MILKKGNVPQQSRPLSSLKIPLKTAAGKGAVPSHVPAKPALSPEQAREKEIMKRRQALTLTYFGIVIVLLFLPLIFSLFVRSPVNFAITVFIEVIVLIYFIADYIHLMMTGRARKPKHKVSPLLVNYVKKELKAGYSVDSVRKAFYKQGYKKEYVERVIAEAQNMKKEKTSFKGVKLK